MSADNIEVAGGQKAILTATASSTVTYFGGAIEIFDTTAGTLIGACGENSRCVVAYSAEGGTHAFQAFFTAPTTEVPVYGAAVASNVVTVTWLQAGIRAGRSLAMPHEGVVVTATSAMDVQPGGRWLEIYDLTSDSRVTYCTRGSVCSTSITEADGMTHRFVGYVTGTPDSISQPVDVTWLSVKLTATRVSLARNGAVMLRATVDTDLAGSSWQLATYDSSGHLVGKACTSGRTCTAITSANGNDQVSYTARLIASGDSMSNAPGRADARGGAAVSTVVAESDPVTATRLLWGVDSCKAFTTDPTASGGLYRQVASMLGAPDFWGRYLTSTACAGISPAEIAAAAHTDMGILPIYDDYDCSAVRSYATGAGYAASATAAAQRLGIPAGVGLAIDIEPPGPQCPGAGSVDGRFIEGWHDAISAAGYVPVYYGNGTAGSEFAGAWCTAVADAPGIAADSYVWSFEPSLVGNFTRSTAPDFAPFAPPCDATVAAWQYHISTGSAPDVDHDVAQSSLPLWYPTS